MCVCVCDCPLTLAFAHSNFARYLPISLYHAHSQFQYLHTCDTLVHTFPGTAAAAAVVAVATTITTTSTITAATIIISTTVAAAIAAPACPRIPIKYLVYKCEHPYSLNFIQYLCNFFAISAFAGCFFLPLISYVFNLVV